MLPLQRNILIRIEVIDINIWISAFCPIKSEIGLPQQWPSICAQGKIMNWKGANCGIAYPVILNTVPVCSVQIYTLEAISLLPGETDCTQSSKLHLLKTG